MSKEKKDNKKLEFEKLQKQCEEYLNGWKRSQADYENFKKQSEKEKQEFVKFANLNLIINLIPVYNNLKHSFRHLTDDLQNNDWVIGVKHIKNQFKKILEQNNVEEIIPKEGDEFNAEIHEAVKEIEKGEIEKLRDKNNKNKNKISKIISCGYKLNGKVFLPAKVIVK